MTDTSENNPLEIDGFYKDLLDNMQIGIIVADARGRLIYINGTYSKFLNIDIGASLGRHATEVISNSRLHEVAKTGIPEINYPHKFKNIGYLVHRVPIKRDGKVVAVMGLVLFDSATTALNLAEKLAHLETRLKHYQKELATLHSTRYTFDHIIGPGPAMQAAKAEAMKTAANDLPVLITGESGTGKELFAQAIHHAGSRRDYPFVRVNCAALPRDLLEAELFGYEKGSFTGAHPKGKTGKFEVAHMGTIFLDEIGDMPIDMQPKLLRVLELKEFEKVGGMTPIYADFRVIAATNQNLDRLMKSGQFRRDLFYRLEGAPIRLEPLRNRPEDIIPLAYYFIEKTIRGPAGRGIRIHESARKAMEAYQWPGNARELRHTILRILYNDEPDAIRLSHLPDYIRPPAMVISDRAAGNNLNENLKAAEKQFIEEALRQTGGNKTRAADLLGIHRTLLYRKIKLLGISG